MERDMLQATRRSLRIAKAKRLEWKNQYPLITWSLKWMASHSCSVLPNDKEPGFTVASKLDVLTIHQQILSRPCYEEVDPDLWIEAVMLKEYRCLCVRVAKAEGNSELGSMLLRSVRT
ncbi:MAG: hypothetical protein ACKPKO_36105, partial [Candidatus Fonsibacter sp.]